MEVKTLRFSTWKKYISFEKYLIMWKGLRTRPVGTTLTPVCVPAVIGGLAVWRHNQKQNQISRAGLVREERKKERKKRDNKAKQCPLVGAG